MAVGRLASPLGPARHRAGGSPRPARAGQPQVVSISAGSRRTLSLWEKRVRVVLAVSLVAISGEVAWRQPKGVGRAGERERVRRASEVSQSLHGFMWR